MAEQALDKQLEQNINAMTDGGKLAIVLCAGSFRFGGNWGFIRGGKDLKGQIETLKEERPNVKAIPVANGALIQCNENFLAHNVNLAVPGAIGGAFVDRANKRKSEEKARFAKFMKNVETGKSAHVKKGANYSEITFGIFCVNDTNAIRVNGKEYPAYKMTLLETLEFANRLVENGRKVYVRAVKPDGVAVFDEIRNLSNSKGLQAIYKGLEISETDTGVFITLRIR